jgi:hypothetical protein
VSDPYILTWQVEKTTKKTQITKFTDPLLTFNE